MHGFDCELLGFEMTGAPPAGDVHSALETLRKAMAPAPTRVIASEIARLRVMTKSRAESDEDLQLMAAAYVEELAAYPADVVIDACRTWARREKFWPAWHELQEMLDRRVKKRRAMLEALERAA